jgi:putative DNA primase/helicase
MSEVSEVRQVSESEKARQALQYIDPSCDRLTWVRMATALKDEFGQDGFELFDAWSKGSDKYEKHATRDTWKSVKPGRGVSIGSLYHEAKKGGFRPHDWQTEAAPVRQNDEKRAAERAAALAQAEQEAAQQYAEAAQKAIAIYKQGHPVTADHPYIVRKSLQDHPWLQPTAAAVAPREMAAGNLAKLLGYKPKADGVPLSDRVLLIPMINGSSITTLEFIDEHGRKSALAGGLKKGSWHTPVPMGKHLADNPNTPIVVVEGWATAYSTQHAFMRPELQMPGAYVVSAGADTNLGNVARALRAQHPKAPIIIGADVGNPDSMTYARKAAASVGGSVMAPKFTDEQIKFLEGHLGKAPTDFNDQNKYYVANDLPLDDFQLDLRHAIDLAEFPDREEFPDLVQEVATSPASQTVVTPLASATTIGDRSMEAKSAGAPAQNHEPGQPLFDIKNLPAETRDAVQRVFGNRHALYAPRENGGPYSGEVRDVSGYIVQEVGPRSLIVHDKKAVQFANDRLKWMDDNNKLNGHELSFFYNGSQAKAYPYDRVRDDLDRAVGSFKKSAKDLGLDPQFADQLDKAFAKSMDRIQGLRKEAQAKTRESRTASTPAEAAPEISPKR